METLFRIFYLPFLLVVFASCVNSKKQQPGTQEIKNLHNQIVSIDSLETLIKFQMKEMDIPGLSLAIINNSKLVYTTTKGYANTETKQLVNNQTIFECASISKPVFAYLIMHLVEEGKLELDKPLYEYLDFQYPGINYQDERYKKITARTVLSHSTGFPNWRGNSNLNIEFEPGTAFGYSGEGYQYLVKVIEAILDTDYKGIEAYFQEKVAIPLKMRHATYIQNSYTEKNKASAHKNGKTLPRQSIAKEFNAAAGLHAEAKDYSKWLIAVLNRDGLTTQSYNELFTDQITTPETSWFLKVGITNWTLGFAKHKMEFLKDPIYGHIGNNEGFTSLFLIDLKRKWGLITFTNTDQADDFGFKLFEYLNKMN